MDKKIDMALVGQQKKRRYGSKKTSDPVFRTGFPGAPGPVPAPDDNCSPVVSSCATFVEKVLLMKSFDHKGH
jgi:hypothetical protein